MTAQETPSGADREPESAPPKSTTPPAGKKRKLGERRYMPVVEPVAGPQEVRVVDAPLVSPVPVRGFKGVMSQRYLMTLMVKREIASKYAASLLGLMWSYIQPALRFAVYYFVFGFVFTHRGVVPMFALRLFTGIVVVGFFSQTWSQGTRSIWANRQFVLKMRLPREIFPVAAMITAAYHTGPQVLILVVSCLAVGWHLDAVAIVAGLAGVIIVVTFGLALSLVFSVLNVYARDFQNIVGTITQFMHFLVPMMYPFSMIYTAHDSHPVIYQLYMANPVSTAVLLLQRFFWYPAMDAADQASVDTPFPPDLWQRGAITLVACLVMLWLAQRIFTRLEGSVAERL